MQPDALSKALWSVVAHRSDHLLTLDFKDGTRRETSWFPAWDDQRFCSMLTWHRENGNDPRVGLVPRRDKSIDNAAESCVLWAVIENPVSVRSLTAFRPLPTIIWKMGRTRVAVWWLDEPLPILTDPSKDWLTVANRRLAFALKANSARADPETLLPVGKAELLVADPARCYSPSEVVSRLKDAPVRLRSAPSPKIVAA